jgi:hypothetical protein
MAKSNQFIQRHQLAQMGNLAPGHLGLAPLTALAAARHHRRAEAELGGLFETAFHLTHGAHLAGQSDFAEDNRLARNGAIVEARQKRRSHGEIGRRLLHLQAARDVEIDVAAGQRHAAACLEHR